MLVFQHTDLDVAEITTALISKFLMKNVEQILNFKDTVIGTRPYEEDRWTIENCEEISLETLMVTVSVLASTHDLQR